MKFIPLILLVFYINLSAQYEIYGGMGLNFTKSEALNNYISDFKPIGEAREDFNSSVEFYGEVARTISERFQMGIEFFYSIYSYNTNIGGVGKFEISNNTSAPTLMGYYLVQGAGYQFRLGGGIGYRFVSLDNTNPLSTVPVTYTTSGPGFMIKTDGNTALSKNLFINIGLLLKYDFPGVPEHGGKKLVDVTDNSEVKLTSFAAGIRFGLAYTF